MSAEASQPLSPWMKPLDEKSREAVRRNVAHAPPLTERQRNRLRMLFMQKPTTGRDQAESA